MAVLKHIASKNSDYDFAFEYLTHKFDEITNKPVLDDNGCMQLRDAFLIEGLECTPETFARECELTNQRFHKNQSFNEIKSHHYILSFDPKDAEDGLLDGEKAQKLGLEFTRKYFAGHEAIVCTHLDGHSGSGNIHCHIVINSVRKKDVERQDFMARGSDSRAGFKHHLTKDLERDMKKTVMEICGRERLHQVDLLSPAKEKVTEAEYWAERRGQKKLDELNKKISDDGLAPSKTKFETGKQQLRDAIRICAGSTDSFESFTAAMKAQYQVDVKLSRGRISFLLPGRQKWIRGRNLGAVYELKQIERLFSGHANDKVAPSQESEKQASDKVFAPNTEPYDKNYDYHADPVAIIFIKSDLWLVTDLQNNIKAQQSAAYARKVKLSNLTKMANTVLYVQEHSYNTTADLDAKSKEISEKYQTARHDLRATEDRLKEVNRQIHYGGAYLGNKRIFQQMLKEKNKKSFRQEHQKELNAYEEARTYFKEHCDGYIPNFQDLKEEKAQLLLQKEAQRQTYRYFRDYKKKISIAQKNISSILKNSCYREQTKSYDKEL